MHAPYSRTNEPVLRARLRVDATSVLITLFSPLMTITSQLPGQSQSQHQEQQQPQPFSTKGLALNRVQNQSVPIVYAFMDERSSVHLEVVNRDFGVFWRVGQ